MNQNDIVDAFKNELGREPTQAELGYFLKMGEGVGGVGAMQSYEAQQAIGATPEAQMRALGQYTDMYGQKLGQSDQYMMSLAGNQLQSQFRQMGRPSSSGYISAFAQAAQNLAMNRQQQMAQFYGGGLGGVMDNRLASGQGALNRSYQLQENQRQFNRDQDLANRNYARQMDYANLQEREGLQMGLIKGGIGLGTSILGGWAGGALAGGIGAGAGMAGGSMLGKYTSGQLRGDYSSYHYGSGR